MIELQQSLRLFARRGSSRWSILLSCPQKARQTSLGGSFIFFAAGFGCFFWVSWFLLLCPSAFCFSASLLVHFFAFLFFCFSCLASFFAFLLLCFSTSVLSVFFAFPAFPPFWLFCFSAFCSLLFCLSAFCFLLFLLFLLSCFSALCFLLFFFSGVCFSCFLASLLFACQLFCFFCFSAFLILSLSNLHLTSI